MLRILFLKNIVGNSTHIRSLDTQRVSDHHQITDLDSCLTGSHRIIDSGSLLKDWGEIKWNIL
jgi:hypothetical protein